jgi:hypothetical protein
LDQWKTETISFQQAAEPWTTAADMALSPHSRDQHVYVLGHYLLIYDRKGVLVWSVTTGDRPPTILSDRWLNCRRLAFHPTTGHLFITHPVSQTIQIWSPTTHETVHTFKQRVSDMVVDHHGQLLIVNGHSPCIQVIQETNQVLECNLVPVLVAEHTKTSRINEKERQQLVQMVAYLGWPSNRFGCLSVDSENKIWMHDESQLTVWSFPL